MDNSTSSSQNIEKTSSTPATVAGASGGTLLVVLAQNLPDDNPFKSWLIILAPAATIAIVAVWKWATKKIVNHWKTKKIEDLKQKIRADIMRTLTNPHFPDAHKEELKRKLAQLEVASVEKLMEGIQSVEIDFNA